MASPFGVSIVDLVKAIKLAHDIYKNCFTEEQGAGESSYFITYLCSFILPPE